MHSTLALTALFGHLAANVAHASPLSPRITGRQSTPIWETLPPTPDLPAPITNKTMPINGVNLWMQEYNPTAGGTPLVLLHGGLGYSAYMGAVLTRLIAANYHVIAADRRGHGRSTFLPTDVFTYDQFASDTFDQLAAAGISTPVNVVGWSDGGITTIAALLNSTLAPKIGKAFLFGASTSPADTNATFGNTAIFNTFVTRCGTEYAELQPTANFTEFALKVQTLEDTLPNFTDAQLGSLPGANITIAAAEYDEAVKLAVPGMLHAKIPGSTLVTLEGVSHFAPLQDPEGFTKAVEDFLAA